MFYLRRFPSLKAVFPLTEVELTSIIIKEMSCGIVHKTNSGAHFVGKCHISTALWKRQALEFRYTQWIAYVWTGLHCAL